MIKLRNYLYFPLSFMEIYFYLILLIGQDTITSLANTAVLSSPEAIWGKRGKEGNEMKSHVLMTCIASGQRFSDGKGAGYVLVCNLKNYFCFSIKKIS